MATDATYTRQYSASALFSETWKLAAVTGHGIILPLQQGIKMIRTLSTLERRARYLMSIIAILSVIAVVLYKTGLVATEPTYDEQAWYSVSERAGFVISTEHGDETACRLAEKLPSVVCHSGKSLIADQRKDPFS